MKILVDTSIWSLALRRKRQKLTKQEYLNIEELVDLIDEGRAVLVGPVRQEILSGISDPSHFSALREKLRAFENFPISTEDYELAASFFNTCRKRGVQGAHIDFLICAVAQRNRMAVFTLDLDFSRYSSILRFALYQARKAG